MVLSAWRRKIERGLQFAERAGGVVGWNAWGTKSVVKEKGQTTRGHCSETNFVTMPVGSTWSVIQVEHCARRNEQEEFRMGTRNLIRRISWKMRWAVGSDSIQLALNIRHRWSFSRSERPARIQECPDTRIKLSQSSVRHILRPTGLHITLHVPDDLNIPRAMGIGKLPSKKL